MQKKIYISGQITGLSQAEAEKLFDQAETQLKGIEPQSIAINPMKIEHNHDKSWLNFMKQDIKALMDCDAIYLLKNWQSSKGAMVEYQLAQALGYQVIHQA